MKKKKKRTFKDTRKHFSFSFDEFDSDSRKICFSHKLWVRFSTYFQVLSTLPWYRDSFKVLWYKKGIIFHKFISLPLRLSLIEIWEFLKDLDEHDNRDFLLPSFSAHKPTDFNFMKTLIITEIASMCVLCGMSRSLFKSAWMKAY